MNTASGSISLRHPMAPHPTQIVVCGLPRSGNRLIRGLLERHGFIAEIRHYGNGKAFHAGGYGERAVLPVRGIEANWRSLHRWPKNDYRQVPPPPSSIGMWPPPRPCDVHFEHFWPTMRTLALQGVPCLPVVYEEMIVDDQKSEVVGRHIVEWAAGGKGIVEWRGWEVDLFDGNEKYECAEEDQVFAGKVRSRG